MFILVFVLKLVKNNFSFNFQMESESRELKRKYLACRASLRYNIFYYLKSKDLRLSKLTLIFHIIYTFLHLINNYKLSFIHISFYKFACYISKLYLIKSRHLCFRVKVIFFNNCLSKRLQVPRIMCYLQLITFFS